MNGRIHGELKSPERSAADELRHRVHLLDGASRFSLILWKLPQGVAFDDVDLRIWPQEYVQAAGGRDRFTVEERTLQDGVAVQVAVGREEHSAEGDPTEVVVWNGCDTVVHEHEVWTATEVADLFVAYYLHGRLPAGLTRRVVAV
jgi:hypothetical protein